jgi:hypothetical protein
METTVKEVRTRVLRNNDLGNYLSFYITGLALVEVYEKGYITFHKKFSTIVAIVVKYD